MHLPFRFVLSCLLGLIVCLLFQVSQNVQSAESKLHSLQKGIIDEQEKIRVYTAEWAYLTRPERLEKLAEQYTQLRTVDGSNYLNIADIPLTETMQAVILENSDEAETSNPVPYRVQAMDMHPDIVKELHRKQQQLANLSVSGQPKAITVAFKDIWGGHAP